MDSQTIAVMVVLSEATDPPSALHLVKKMENMNPVHAALYAMAYTHVWAALLEMRRG